MQNNVFNEESIAQLPDRVRANLINSLSGFKSANLIGTTSVDGVNNLAIVSSVFHIGANPPLVGMIMRPHTVVRDTLSNIKDTGVYTINHVHTDIAKQAHQCSARYAPNVDEFAEVGLSAQMSERVKAPFVAQSRIKMAVELEQITQIALNKTELVIGKIVEVLIGDDYLHADGYVDIEKAESVAVSCLDSYHATQRIDRFSYAKPDQDLYSIWQASIPPK
jgi:flavin reductase (DIM6/NTAB) family NADH-FMN oxidoreductase RutF